MPHQGFSSAESLAVKVVSVLESCQLQLSPQKHYDFGLRALKSVLASAGIIRRDLKAATSESLTEGDEERIVSDAFKSSILPKLLKQDATALLDVLMSVFTLQSASRTSDSEFIEKVALSCKTLHLSPSSQWIEKLLQIKQLVRCHLFHIGFKFY